MKSKVLGAPAHICKRAQKASQTVNTVYNDCLHLLATGPLGGCANFARLILPGLCKPLRPQVNIWNDKLG